jgi:hypothetical protein
MTRSIDFEGINNAARSNGRSLLIALIPGGKFNSSEYTVRNPSRADKNAGSFSINFSTGKWADFATGAKGGDIISWYVHARASNRLKRRARLLKNLGSRRIRTPMVRAESSIVLFAPTTTQQPLRFLGYIVRSGASARSFRISSAVYGVAFGSNFCKPAFRHASPRSRRLTDERFRISS